MAFKNYRDESRKIWGNQFAEGENLSLEQINTGAILRIADATEKMVAKYTQMERDLECYKLEYKKLRSDIEKLNRSKSALSGHLKRIKNKISKVS